MRSLCRTWLGPAVVALCWAAPHESHALSFNFTQISGDSLSAAQFSAFTAAGAAWSALLSDPVSVNVGVGFKSLQPGVLGETAPNTVTYAAGQVIAALVAHSTSVTDMLADASLVVQPPSSRIAVTTTEARALGLAASAVGGTIEFSTGFTFATSRGASGTVPSNSFDMIGVAEHEIAHVLGFDSTIDGTVADGSPTLLDQFRFTKANTRTATAGAAYFSLNDGATAVLDPLGNPAAFSPGGLNNYEASHWAPGVSGVMVPAYSPGQAINITTLDLTALDALGYNTVFAMAQVPEPLPEPHSALVIVLALTGFGLARRRR